MIRRDYLIVGAGVAAASVCEALRSYDSKGSVMMVGNEPYLPYHRPKLFESLLPKQPVPVEKLLHLKQAWYDRQKVDLRLDTLVTQFDIDKRIAVLANGQAVEFKKACLCTGSRPRRPVVAGANLGNVIYVRTIRDVLALREVSAEKSGVVVVGGGYIAAETAALLRTLKRKVALMSRHACIWQRFLDSDTASWLNDQYAKHGVELMMQESLNGFEGKTVLKNVQTKSGRRFPAGMALVALGAEPNMELVLQTPLSSPQGVPVNEYLETDEKGIFAAGDVALYPDRVLGGMRRAEHWESAIEQGKIAGANITGRKRQKFEYVPYHASKLFDLQFEFVGDFSRLPGRVEIDGDRVKKKFALRYYQEKQLQAVVLCNQPGAAALKAREEFRK